LLVHKSRTAIQTYRRSGLAGVAKLILQKMSSDGSVQNIDISNDYINWLCFANAGMLSRGNLYCFDYALRNLPNDAPIIEIGAFCGLSTNALAYYKEKHGVKNRLINCDRWIFENSEQGGMLGDHLSLTHAEYREFVKDSYTRNVKMFSRGDLPFTVELFSDEFFDSWRDSRRVVDIFERPINLGGPISFCYVDGNHSYEYVRRDFENCDQFLVPGGFIFFDDSADDSGWEVCKLVAEVQSSGRYELIIKNPNYLFRKNK
jgi:predicted O-methyltransferase YrrM